MKDLYDIKFEQWSLKSLISIFVIFISVYLSAFSAFLLGVISRLPRSIISLFSDTTLIHLAGKFSFIMITVLAVYAVSQAVFFGLLSLGTFVIFKVSVAPKRRWGIHDTAVNRLHNYRLNRLNHSKKNWSLRACFQNHFNDLRGYILAFPYTG